MTLEKKPAMEGVTSDGKLYPSGTSKLKFKVGTGGRIVVRAIHGGYNWGDSPNRIPAEYVFVFVP